jgi:hypothetical protein
MICTAFSKAVMEKRILGIIFSLLGTAGLILAAVYFVEGGSGTRNIKSIVIYAVLGAIFFFAGVGLIRNTKDKPS